jgi:hypothetical protein
MMNLLLRHPPHRGRPARVAHDEVEELIRWQASLEDASSRDRRLNIYQ